MILLESPPGMWSEGLEPPDVSTYEVVVDACEAAGQYGLARCLLEAVGGAEV